MDKTIIAQYCDLQTEVKDIRKRIDKLQQQLNKLDKEKPIVSDTVKGSREDGTIGPIKISGFPAPEFYQKKKLLEQHLLKLRGKEDELLEMTIGVEEYIEQQDNSRIRSILRYRYLDNLTWIQIGHRMGRDNTSESCRKAHDRFFEKV